ncbi:MAG: diaminopropionate ammonia-lyase, partial [Eubacterium sp.]|nr:diaminopropionate ammonia-lyase [Eubacterium sp.]
SADGMRVLSSPVASDARIISGESGAAAFGAAYNLLTDEKLSDIKNRLKINENSVLLFISTEGATDRTSYDQIVWRGKYASL